ncbi:hypothetical protein SAMN02745116_00067 [Pilibacter termitis]|uniref:Short-chain dehydrogenase n=1 Tax=Pilibacter termitis TaxID=263852 RepID=A0A1T4K3S2_9ENTE|nr:SDR family oxidoreductase [Pilibacter termitis]SJZ36965.1 hypothetical protein SAMN02745116_00067 [Pilibacter termitis]
MKNKTIVITGATSGLGEAIAHVCAKRKAHLILLGRNAEKLKEIQESLLQQHQVQCETYQADFLKIEEVQAVGEKIARKYSVIDVLINNAGVGYFEEFSNLSVEKITATFQTNVLSLMVFSKILLPNITKSKGEIINISSMSAKFSSPKSSIYAASKAAVTHFSNILRLELAKKSVRVRLVHTGPIRTPFHEKADKTGEYAKKVEKWMLNADKLAEEISQTIGTKKRELNRPRLMSVASVWATLFPRITDYFSQNVFNYK